MIYMTDQIAVGFVYWAPDLPVATSKISMGGKIP